MGSTNMTKMAPEDADKGAKMIGEALKLGMSLNHLNRSMGLQDIYPFVITPKVREKLIFAHTAIRQPPLKASGRQARPIVAAS